ncbi:hypothetical protein B0H13DRAFT_2013075, partial [Mycena leptocephala]
MQPPISYLHILPVEIWLACWILASTRQRRRLSLRQSADFAALVEGLNRDNWVELRLDRLAGTPLVLAVRNWKISSAPPLPQRWTTPLSPGATRAERLVRRVVEDYSHIWHIGSFNAMCDRNLTCLDIQGMIIDISFRQTLTSLSRLQELILDECKIIPLEGILLNLCRLTICATRQRGTAFRRNASDESASPEDRLLELNLHAEVQSTSLIAGFGDAMLSNLGHLSLHALFKADRCPRLELLIIPSISRSSGTHLPQYLPQHVLPLLQNLTVPWDIRSYGAKPGSQQPCPIDDMKGVFIDISRSSIPIRSLVIPCTSSTIETWLYRIDLNDEEAFDNLPAEVLSDSERASSARASSKPAQTPLAAVSLWADPPNLLNRAASLSTRCTPKQAPPLPAIPSGTYSIRPPKGASRPSRDRRAAAIAALSRQYLRLREVTLGPSVWQIPLPDSYELL